MIVRKKMIDPNAQKEKLWSMFNWFGELPCTEQDKLAQAVIKKCIEEVDKTESVIVVEESTRFIPGQECWIIQRDDIGEPYEIVGVQYLAYCTDFVIVAPYVGDSNDLREALCYHMEESRVDMQSCLLVYPAGDCYGDEDDAREAFRSETGVEYVEV